MTVFHPVPEGVTGCANCGRPSLEVVYDVGRVGRFGVMYERSMALYCRHCHRYYDATGFMFEQVAVRQD